LKDPHVREIAGKVTYSARDFREFPASFPALVRLHLHNGEVHESLVPHNLGSAGAPFTASDVERKFRKNVEFAIGKPSADLLHQAIVDLPCAAETAQLRAALGAARVNPRASNTDPAPGGKLCYGT